MADPPIGARGRPSGAWPHAGGARPRHRHCARLERVGSKRRGAHRVIARLLIGRMPAQRTRSSALREHVGELAEQRVEQDADHHHVGLQELARVHRHVADARLRRDRFRHDQHHPHQPEREAHADENRRQRARQDHVAIQREARQPITARHLDQVRIDRTDAVKGVHVDREKHAERDQEKLGLLADAEPQDHERNHRERGDVADHLERRIERGLGGPEKAGREAEHEADAAADARNPTPRATS